MKLVSITSKEFDMNVPKDAWFDKYEVQHGTIKRTYKANERTFMKTENGEDYIAVHYYELIAD